MDKGSWQFALALSLAIIVFGGGTMTAVILGRPVPEALWPLDGGLVVAITGAQGFFTLRQSGAQAMGHLAELASVRIGAAGAGTTTTIATGDPVKVETAKPQPQGGAQ